VAIKGYQEGLMWILENLHNLTYKIIYMTYHSPSHLLVLKKKKEIKENELKEKEIKENELKEKEIKEKK